MSNNKIIDRVRKLRQMADHGEGNEAEVAARLVAKLMAEHALEEADLEEASEAMCVEVYHLDGLLLKEGRGRWNAKTQWWKRRLSMTCAHHVGLVWRYYRGTAKVALYGYPWQMEICRYLYEICARQIEKKAKAFLKERREKAVHPYWQSARSAGTEFRNGAVEGVHQLLWQQRKAAEAEQPDEAALVLDVAAQVQRWADETYPCTRRARSGWGGSAGSSEEGRRAGASIHVHSGVRTSSPRAAITSKT